MVDRLLLRGGFVVSMDPEVGDLKGDVLIEDDRIAAVGPDLEAGDAQVLDVSGDIVIPGLIDTHRHTWETAIRGCAPDATLEAYFVEILDTFAPKYRPEDVYASNLAGALECVNAGITTLLDWSHINNTPEHPDAAVQGLRDAGIRAQYAYGSANTSLAEYWFNSTIVMPREDVERVRDTYFPSDDGLLTMALATRGPGFCVDDVVRQEWAMARELGLPITLHAGMGRQAGRFGMVKMLDKLGLLGDDTTFIHACYFDEEEWELVKASGGRLSIAPLVEMQMGHGCPPTGMSRALGLRPSLSVDVVTTVPGDLFTQMRAAFGCEREKVNAGLWQRDEDAPADMLSARDMLEFATRNGAYVLGLEEQTGSLTPGKQADVVVIDGRAPNVAPVLDPVATVVVEADVSNVDTVIIGGRIHKQDGKLTGDWDRARRLVEESRDHLVNQVERQPRWTAVPAS